VNGGKTRLFVGSDITYKKSSWLIKMWWVWLIQGKIRYEIVQS